jgi:hypothetical protein
MTGSLPERRLSKRDVETLLARYDDDPVTAIAVALGRLSDRPNATFAELVDDLGERGLLSADRHHALLVHDVAALDALAAELNETRSLPS